MITQHQWSGAYSGIVHCHGPGEAYFFLSFSGGHHLNSGAENTPENHSQGGALPPKIISKILLHPSPIPYLKPVQYEGGGGAGSIFFSYNWGAKHFKILDFQLTNIVCCVDPLVSTLNSFSIFSSSG